MRIAFVVDVHDRFGAVEGALRGLEPLDVLVVGGDITTFGTPEDAERAIELWRPLASRLFAVAGNCDSPAIDARLAELGVSIDAQGASVGEVGFAGASGSPYTPLHTPHELPDDEYAARAARGLAAIAESKVRILCPHAPPFGTECDRLRDGRQVGSVALRELVEREQPDLVLCGHIHESRAIDELGSTRIANPGPVAEGHYAFVEVGETVTLTLD
jgi:Icc-related predicted phosphoesterase